MYLKNKCSPTREKLPQIFRKIKLHLLKKRQNNNGWICHLESIHVDRFSSPCLLKKQKSLLLNEHGSRKYTRSLNSFRANLTFWILKFSASNRSHHLIFIVMFLSMNSNLELNVRKVLTFGNLLKVSWDFSILPCRKYNSSNNFKSRLVLWLSGGVGWNCFLIRSGWPWYFLYSPHSLVIRT